MDRWFLFFPVLFLMGVGVALNWVENTLHLTDAQQLETLQDAQSVLRLAVPLLLLGAVLVQALLRARDRRASPDQRAMAD